MKTRHWNLIQALALTALLPLFAACSSEGDELLQSEEKQPVQVNITRAVTDGNDWAWGTGDEVTLSITPYSSTATTHKLTYDGSNWSANPEIGEITLPAIAQAYYPGTISSDVNIVSMDEFKVNCTQITSYKAGDAYINGYIDQSSKDKMAKFDWMTAQQNISEPSFNLTLAHILCLVTVNIKDITGFAEQTPTISEFRIYTNEHYSNYYGSIMGNYIEAIPYQEGSTYKAIIAPSFYDGMQYTGAPPLLKVVVNDITMYAYISDRLQGGTAYTYNLTVKNPNATTTRSAGASECELELVDVEDMNK